jgi:hypothetical protein
MSEIAFGRTSSRNNLRGSLADLSFLARTRFITSQHETLEQIARDLPETPLIAPFDGARPSAVTRKLFGVERAMSIGWRRVAPVRDCPEALGASQGSARCARRWRALDPPFAPRTDGNYTGANLPLAEIDVAPFERDHLGMTQRYMHLSPAALDSAIRPAGSAVSVQSFGDIILDTGRVSEGKING